MDRRTAIGLFVVFGLLLLYVLISQQPDQVLARATATPTPLPGGKVWDITSDRITGVMVVNTAQYRGTAFSKDAQGLWAITLPKAGQTDQNTAASGAAQFAQLSYTTTIENPADLSAFGLAKPAYKLQITLTDGSLLTAFVGDLAPTGTAYYVLREGETTILMVNKYAIDPVIKLLDAPPYVIPTATPAMSATPTTAPSATAVP